MTVSRSLGLLAVSSLIAGAAVASTDPVNVNEAGIDRLQQLNGVGPATAEAIIQDRQENGPFDRSFRTVRRMGHSIASTP